MPKINEVLIKSIAVTAELTSTEISLNAARMMAEDLSEYPLDAVLKALAKCRREIKSRLSLAHIIERIDDGRPGENEAWAMIPKDESGSVVWTHEMAIAFGICSSLLLEGNLVQARAAFIEAYQARRAMAREKRTPVAWSVSLGHDPMGREHVLTQAVELGRITRQHALRIMPHMDQLPACQLVVQNDGDGLKKLNVVVPFDSQKKA